MCLFARYDHKLVHLKCCCWGPECQIDSDMANVNLPFDFSVWLWVSDTTINQKKQTFGLKLQLHTGVQSNQLRALQALLRRSLAELSKWWILKNHQFVSGKSNCGFKRIRKKTKKQKNTTAEVVVFGRISQHFKSKTTTSAGDVTKQSPKVSSAHVQECGKVVSTFWDRPLSTYVPWLGAWHRKKCCAV